MELTVGERLMALMILPEQGSFATMRIVHDLRMNLGFDEAETAEVDLRQTGEGAEGRVVWDGQKAKPKDIPIGPRGIEVMRKRLEELDKDGKLTVQHLSLCEKFGLE